MQVAIEKGLRTNIAENFMSSLKTLFQESYIEVPESKTDLYSELEKESAQLKEDLAKQIILQSTYQKKLIIWSVRRF